MKKKLILFLTVVVILLILDQEIKPFERKSGIKGVPKGDLISELKSPNEKYLFRLYETTGDATVGFGRLGEIENVKNHKRKIIYQNYPDDKSEISWVSNTNILVNGKTLNIKNDVYNYKRHFYNYFKGYYSKNK